MRPILLLFPARKAAFAVIGYGSAWLRVYCPLEYFCDLLRNVPLGTCPAHVLESEARRSGIAFLPFDLTRRPSPTLVDVSDERARLRPMLPEHKLALTFATTGVTAGPHLVEVRRNAFTEAGCVPFRALHKLHSGVKIRAGAW